jgi:hypothetical protein
LGFHARIEASYSTCASGLFPSYLPMMVMMLGGRTRFHLFR